MNQISTSRVLSTQKTLKREIIIYGSYDYVNNDSKSANSCVVVHKLCSGSYNKIKRNKFLNDIYFFRIFMKDNVNLLISNPNGYHRTIEFSFDYVKNIIGEKLFNRFVVVEQVGRTLLIPHEWNSFRINKYTFNESFLTYLDDVSSNIKAEVKLIDLKDWNGKHYYNSERDYHKLDNFIKLLKKWTEKCNIPSAMSMDDYVDKWVKEILYSPIDIDGVKGLHYRKE